MNEIDYVILSDQQIDWIEQKTMNMIDVTSQYAEKKYISDDDWRTLIDYHLGIAKKARDNFMIISIVVTCQSYLGKKDVLAATEKMDLMRTKELLQVAFKRMKQGECSKNTLLKDINTSNVTGFLEQSLLNIFDGYSQYYQMQIRQRKQQQR